MYVPFGSLQFRPDFLIFFRVRGVQRLWRAKTVVLEAGSFSGDCEASHAGV
jgi:hypothetical protein